MTHFDIFNGDADGICALTQLRLAEPRERTVVTGVKRDIALVAKAELEAGDTATVLDISFDKNRDAVQAALAKGVEIFYVDHHFAGDLPEHRQLTAHIETTPTACTSLLVNAHLNGRFAAWAAVGTYGDNLATVANALLETLGIDKSDRNTLEELGTLINYNGYGSTIEDLHFSPAELQQRAQRYRDPLEFVAEDVATFETLRAGYRDDMARAFAVRPTHDFTHAAIFVFPNANWARRVGGVYGNHLATEHPARAHAIATEQSDGSFLISVRAPLENRTGADEICRQFPTGGGRKAAAGINALPADQFENFVATLANFYAS